MLLIRRGWATPDVLGAQQKQVVVTVGLKAIGSDQQARLSYSTAHPAVTVSATSVTRIVKEAAGTTDVSQTVALTRTAAGPLLVYIDVLVEGAMPELRSVAVSWQ